MSSVLYAQYANHAAYPPVLHSAHLFTAAGWRVHFLGLATGDAVDAIGLQPDQPASQSWITRPRSRLLGPLAYPRFLVQARAEVMRRKPDILYCSDLRSYPLGLWAARRGLCKTVLHEHDPPTGASGTLHAWLMKARTAFAREATLCILPQDERARTFAAETGADRIEVVYNCPLRRDIRPPKPGAGATPFVLWYHGSINAKRLPETIVAALAKLPSDVRLEIAGYETLSSTGYVARLKALAEQLHVSDRFVYHGPLSFEPLLARSESASLGLAVLARDFGMPMVGASVKPFDYLACGLPLLVNDTPEWRDFYVAQGTAAPCNPDSADDIARAVLDLRNDPERMAAMAARGYELMTGPWNYETQFAKAARRLGLPLPAANAAFAPT